MVLDHSSLIWSSYVKSFVFKTYKILAKAPYYVVFFATMSKENKENFNWQYE